MLDLQAILSKEQTIKTVVIDLQSEEYFPGHGLQITMRVPPADVLTKLSNKYFRAGFDDGEISMRSDLLGYAVSLLKYAEEWEGFSGELDKDALEKFFKRFPAVGNAFARGCLEAFSDVQKREAEAALAEKKS